MFSPVSVLILFGGFLSLSTNVLLWQRRQKALSERFMLHRRPKKSRSLKIDAQTVKAEIRFLKENRLYTLGIALTMVGTVFGLFGW